MPHWDFTSLHLPQAALGYVPFGDANNKVAYGYDALGRMASRTITANGSVYSSNYGYVAGG